ncbi:bacterial regulatory helix-turn-helix s, AraC family protein [Janthinobacterium agaricidamnosum NBRC 102515 = DSM 9628]|uniref:Bacterial regulatory helix-turn-helix s, AraC family protein n=2 Tax=Janthinobacterium agaricidamnosum TaxID=55508 RepID=W0V1M0_9BURK|nr:bacterial regulatory helix-turn-helix s, AraC family protein [Janthinobacterium agaricidamnosum NBRC 102515 = DSM 9628]
MHHLTESLSVEQLAQVAKMSTRNFARVFVKQMNVTPAQFVQQVRIATARHLLENSGLALKTIAYHCGFGSPARMRVVFARHVGMTPHRYRDSLRRREPEG